MRRKRGERFYRRVAPLLFADACPRCGEFLIDRNLGTGQGAYRLPAGWLSANLRSDGGETIHCRCA